MSDTESFDGSGGGGGGVLATKQPGWLHIYKQKSTSSSEGSLAITKQPETTMHVLNNVLNTTAQSCLQTGHEN